MVVSKVKIQERSRMQGQSCWSHFPSRKVARLWQEGHVSIPLGLSKSSRNYSRTELGQLQAARLSLRSLSKFTGAWSSSQQVGQNIENLPSASPPHTHNSVLTRPHSPTVLADGALHACKVRCTLVRENDITPPGVSKLAPHIPLWRCTCAVAALRPWRCS